MKNGCATMTMRARSFVRRAAGDLEVQLAVLSRTYTTV
jgi:hypothetical protein